MNPSELAAQLQRHVADGQLTLNEATTGVVNLSELSSSVLEGDLKIQNPNVSAEGARVVVVGTAALLGLGTPLPVVAVLTPDGDRVEFTLRAEMPASWKFSQTFPGLPPSVNLSPRRAASDGNGQPSRVSFLDELALKEPRFVLSTRAHRDPELDADIEPGLNFLAEAAAEGPLEVLAPLFGGARFKLGGTVDDTAEPEIYLRASVPAEFGVGPVKLGEMGVLLYSSLEEDGRADPCGVELRCVASLGENVRLQLTSNLPVGFTDRLALAGDFEGAALPGPGALAELVGGDDLEAALPEQLRRLPGLALESFYLNFSPLKAQVNEVALTLRTSQTWAVEFLTVKNIALRVRAVAPLERPRRELFCTLTGRAELAGGEIEVCAEMPGFRIAAALAEGDTMKLSELASTLGGGALELPSELAVTRLGLTGDPGGKLYAFNARVGGDWGVEVGPARLALRDLSLALSYAGGATRRLSGSFQGLAEVAGVELGVSAQSAGAGGWTFAGTIPEIDLETLAEKFLDGQTLPDELPNLIFSDLRVSVETGTGLFEMSGRCTTEWELPFGASGLAVSTVDFSLRRGASTGAGARRVPGPLTCSLRLAGAAPVTIVEGLVFQSFVLDFQLANGGWSLGGSVSARVFDAQLTLSASLEQTPTLRAIVLSLQSPVDTPLLNVEGVGSVTNRAVAIRISKQRTPAAGAGTTNAGATPATTGTTNAVTPATGAPVSATNVSLNPASGSPYTWDFSAAGRLTVANVCTLDGTLRLYRQPGGLGLAFQAQNSEVRIPLPVPQQSIAAHLGLDYVSVTRAADAGTGRSPWGFEAAVSVWFTGLPAGAQELLARRVSGRFKADPVAGTFVSVDRLLQPVEVDLPDLTFGGAKIPLSRALLDAANFSLRWPDGGPQLTADFGLGLPAELNEIFGTRDGRPTTLFFNTYEPGRPETVTRFRLGVDAKAGLNVQPITSPVRRARFEVQGQNTFCLVDMGEYGALKLLVPVFNYDGKSFSARGGFRQLDPVNRPLKLPLKPLKELLGALNLRVVGDQMPDGLPLKDIRIVDDRNNFRTDELVRTLEEAGGPLPAEVKDAISTVGGRADQLPDRFKQYLNVSVPDSFFYGFGVAPDGSFQLDVRVEGDPVKVMYPGLVGLLPGVNCMELRRLSFGTLLGGSLFTLKLDATFDQFDLVTLAASLLLPGGPANPLPPARELERQFVSDDLFMVIFYQAGVPIPVPLFYKELGVEILGIEGLGFGLKWHFPLPEAGLSGLAGLFSDMKPFFTDRHYLLPADTFDRNKLALNFSVSPGYVRLPKYLGGQTLGRDGELFSVSVSDAIVQFLNTLKKPSLAKLIQALPLEHRTGAAGIRFGPLEFKAGGALTTGPEFERLAAGAGQTPFIRRLQSLPADQRADLLALARVAASDADSAVVLLLGDWAVGGMVNFGVRLGLAQSAGGFGLGLAVSGRVADLMRFEARGLAAVVPNASAEGAVRLSGSSSLEILGQKIFKGELELDGERFLMRGALNLFPAASPVQVRGDGLLTVERSGRLFFESAVNVSLARFTLASAKATVTNQSVVLAGQWLGRAVSFALVVRGDRFVMEGAVGLDLRLNFDVKPIYVPGRDIKLADGFRLNTSLSAALGVSLGHSASASGFSATASGSFAWNRQVWSVPPFTLAASVDSPEELTALFAARIQAEAFNLFNSLFASAAVWMQNLMSGALHLGGEAARAMREFYKLSDGQAADALRSLGRGMDEIGSAMRHVYQLSDVQTARVLKKMGFTPKQIGTALESAYGTGAKRAAEIFNAVGYKGKEVAGVLNDTFDASAKDTAKLMKDVFDESDKATEAILKGAGYGKKEVEGAMKSVFDFGKNVFKKIIG